MAELQKITEGITGQEAANIIYENDRNLNAEFTKLEKTSLSYSGYISPTIGFVARLENGVYRDYIASNNYDSAQVPIFKDSGKLTVNGAVILNFLFFASTDFNIETFILTNTTGKIPAGTKFAIINFEKKANPAGYANLRVRQNGSGADNDEVNFTLDEIIGRLDAICTEIPAINEIVHILKDQNGTIVGVIKKDASVEIEKGGFGGENSRKEDITNALKVVLDENRNVIYQITEKGLNIPRLESASLDLIFRGIQTTLTAIASAISSTSYAEDRVKDKVLTSHGRWSTPSTKDLKNRPMFCVHDDDTIDKFIPSSGPSSWMTGGGYQSLLYPLLESVGDIRGNLAMEGQRVGFTADTPELNDNGKICKKLQDEKGWEIMAHSMTARYEYANYLVESLDSELANTILANSNYSGVASNHTTSVYVSSKNKNYMVNHIKQWVEVPTPYIKPYVKDYNTDRVIMYNPTFPVDYQWGEWLRIATSFGFKTKCWVTPGGTSTYVLVPIINRYIPWGFGNIKISQVNTIPLTSTIVRLPMENQPGYIGQEDPDNSYKPELLQTWKKVVDEAIVKKGWVVFALHAYRPCWLNKLPGSLVSEGGTYPDEWVYPLRDITTYPDTYLDPPTEKGINKWSDWTPCPNTRLYMLYEILQYAKQKGMLNVTSSEAFNKIGNLMTVGVFTKGGKWNFDSSITKDVSDYPHFIVGADGSMEYFNN